MAYTNNPYCTLAQVHSALDLTSTAWDNWIANDLIPEAQAFIDEYCGRTWQTDGTVATPTTRLYDGNDRDTLLVDEIVSITSVSETSYLVVLGASGQFNLASTTTVNITADVVLGPTRLVNLGQSGYTLRRITGLPFTQGMRNYAVVGVFGNANLPPAISRAAVRLCVHWYKMRDTNYADLLTEQGGVRQHYSKQLPADIVEVLDRYRRRPMLSRTHGA